MLDRAKLQEFVNNFRRHLAGYLRPAVGVSSYIHPASEAGAVIEFRFGTGSANDDNFNAPEDTLNAILKKIQQRMFVGDIDAVTFGGTNISLEPDRVLLIKGDDKESEWSDEAARRDVNRILDSFKRSAP